MHRDEGPASFWPGALIQGSIAEDEDCNSLAEESRVMDSTPPVIGAISTGKLDWVPVVFVPPDPPYIIGAGVAEKPKGFGCPN